MSKIGFRIYTNIDRPSSEIVKSFKDIPVANIADSMSRFYCVDWQIKPMNQTFLLGTAFTVKSRTADNLLFHKALDLAKPGDVIVVDVQGDMTNAVTGENMVKYAMKRNIAGFLIDGAIRDLGEIRKMDFAVYAKGVTPKGPYKNGPGEINVPVCCGGIVIHPGDIIVGDEDGVVVIPAQDAQEVLKKSLKKVESEAKGMIDIENGTTDRTWIDRDLHQLGCDIIS